MTKEAKEIFKVLETIGEIVAPFVVIYFFLSIVGGYVG